MAGPIQIPFYDYQVNPQSGYAGPSFSDILNAQASPRQGGSLLGAAAEIGERLIERQRKVQEAYDQSQFELAKATYYAKVKQDLEQLQFSKLGPMDYPDRFREVSEEAYAEAQRILNQAQGKTLGGYAAEGRQALFTNFDAWRIEQDASFRSYVLQTQRTKMTEAAMQAKNDQLRAIRLNPEYVAEFEKGVQEEVARGLLPADFGRSIIDKARKLATVADYDRLARGIAAGDRESLKQAYGAPAPAPAGARGELYAPPALPRGGLGAAEAYVADRSHFPLLDDADYEQFKQDFSFYTGNIRLQAESLKDEQVGQAAEDYLKRFANNQLTRDYILNDARTAADPNAPRASDEADEVRRRFVGLLKETYASGGKEADSDPRVKRLAYDYIYDEAVERPDAESFLGRALDAYLQGQPGINFTDYRQGMDEVKQRKVYTGFLEAAKALDAAAGSGLMTPQQATDGTERIRQRMLLRRKQHESDPKVPLMSVEEFSQEAQNLIDDAVHLKEYEGINWNKRPTRQQQAEQKLYSQVQKLAKKGASGTRMKALTQMIQEGSLKGLASQPEWVGILDEAQPFYETEFRKWSGLAKGQYELSRVNYSGVAVFTYSETRSQEEGGGSITVFFTPTYDRQLDRWIWAAYRPSTREILALIDTNTRQPMAFYQARDAAWSNQVRGLTK